MLGMILALGLVVVGCDDGKSSSSSGGGVTQPVATAGITIGQEGPQSVVVGGGTLALTATVTPANAANKAIVWETSDEGKATVSAAGVVTAVAAGEVTITATNSGGQEATILVGVGATGSKAVVLTKSGDTWTAAGNTTSVANAISTVANSAVDVIIDIYDVLDTNVLAISGSGAGRVTVRDIKAAKTVNAVGVNITRPNVTLDGLNFAITDKTKVYSFSLGQGGGGYVIVNVYLGTANVVVQNCTIAWTGGDFITSDNNGNCAYGISAGSINAKTNIKVLNNVIDLGAVILANNISKWTCGAYIYAHLTEIPVIDGNEFKKVMMGVYIDYEVTNVCADDDGPKAMYASLAASTNRVTEYPIVPAPENDSTGRYRKMHGLYQFWFYHAGAADSYVTGGLPTNFGTPTAETSSPTTASLFADRARACGD
jgi:hypothetical protein